jgi:hypothetical protein
MGDIHDQFSSGQITSYSHADGKTVCYTSSSDDEHIFTTGHFFSSK